MPFCCHGYTKAVTQDLMDTFKAKSQKKGNRLRQQEEDEEDEEDVVDEVTLLVTDSRSFFFLDCTPECNTLWLLLFYAL